MILGNTPPTYLRPTGVAQIYREYFKMISRDTNTAGATSANTRRTRLLLGAAVAATAAGLTMPSPVAAGTYTTVVNDTIANIQAKIDAIIITPDAVVTWDTPVGASTAVGEAGTINIADGAVLGEGDGAITITLAGKLGTYNTTTLVVADLVNINVNGDSTLTGNTFNFTSAATGVLTGEIDANVGGNITFKNDGLIINDAGGTINLTTPGSIDFQNAGRIANGSVDLDADNVLTVVAAPVGINSGTNTGGNIVVVSNGTLGSPDGTTRVDLDAFADVGNVDVTVNGVAGDLDIDAGTGDLLTFSNGGEAAPLAGETKTTFVLKEVWGTGKATVTIGATGNVGDVDISTATGGGTLTIDGKVGADNVNDDADIRSTLTDEDDFTIDSLSADGKVTTQVIQNVTTPVGGAVTLTINAGGSVADQVTATSNKGNATVTIGGSAGDDVLASTTGDASTFNSTEVNTNNSILFVTDTSNTFKSTLTQTATGGTALVEVLAGGKVTDNVTARGDGAATATVINSGTIGGTATADSQRTLLTTENITTSSSNFFSLITGVNKTASETDEVRTRALVGGVALVQNNATGVILDGTTVQGATSATLTNDGLIKGDSDIDARVAFTITSSHLNQKDLFINDPLVQTATTESDLTEFTARTLGGTATLTNNKLIEGNVEIEALGNVTITNAATAVGAGGGIRGTIDAKSSGADFTFLLSTSKDSKTDFVTGAVTENEAGTFKFTQTPTGGSVTGTYAGENGADNFGDIDGTITQDADKDSTATVSGAVFGSVNLIAGANQTTSFETSSARAYAVDKNTTGTETGSSTSASSSADAAGTATLNLSGKVADPDGAGGIVANVSLDGTTAAAANLAAGSSIAGNLTVFSALVTDTGSTKSDYAQDITLGNVVTKTLNDEEHSTSTTTGGASSASLGGSVGGNVDVRGVTAAPVTVLAGNRVGGSVYVGTEGNNSSFDAVRTYSRDAATGIATASETTKEVSRIPLATGPATLNVDGNVGYNALGAAAADATTNFATASAGRGDAKTTVTGLVSGLASADALNPLSDTTTESATTWSGKHSSTATDWGSLGLGAILTSSVTTSTSIATGGNASVTIAPTVALIAQAKTSANTVLAEGLTGALVTITAGAKVARNTSFGNAGNNTGDVTATSSTINTKIVTTDTPGPAGTTLRNQVTTNTAVGGTAKIDNKGWIGRNALAQGQGKTTAIILNGPVSYSADGTSFVDGVIVGNATAIGSLSHDSTVTLVDNDVGGINPALRTTVTTTVQKYNDGTAVITNDGVIFGDAIARGSKGTVTNNGVVADQIIVGEQSFAGTTVVTKTDATTVSSFTPQAVLPVQDYLVDQNGTAGEVIVTNATINHPLFGSSVQVKTADIKATINLNNGSYTAFGVDAQRSGTGAYMTTTTVNLNGSGFVGSDNTYLFGQTPVFPNIVDHNPALTLSRAATTVGFGGNPAARIRGVTELNKIGAGTFVIAGGDYIPPAVPAAQPTWTIDAANFNIKAGEVQLSLVSDEDNEDAIRNDPTFVRSEFGIKGNVTNDATLVIGRREPIPPQAVGTKLVNTGTEIIEGTFVRQTGNFTQSKTGNTVVGITPSLVRFSTVGVSTSSGSNEPLGIVSGGVGIPYFTTPANAAFFNGGVETSIPVTLERYWRSQLGGHSHCGGWQQLDLRERGWLHTVQLHRRRNGNGDGCQQHCFAVRQVRCRA